MTISDNTLLRLANISAGFVPVNALARAWRLCDGAVREEIEAKAAFCDVKTEWERRSVTAVLLLSKGNHAERLNDIGSFPLTPRH